MSGVSRREAMLLSAGAGLVATTPMALAQGTVTPPFPASLQQRITETLDGIKAAGGAVTLIKDGKLAAFYGHGRASVAFDQPVRPETRFQIGSVGKQVTAVGVLKLAEQGKLTLDDPIGKHVSGLPDWIQPLSVRLLLGHLSGIPDYEAGFDWDRPFGKEALLKALPAPLFAPGATWVYSNSAYVMLGWLIEALSGLSYADYIQRELFAVAGTPLARADSSETPIPGRAEPYRWVDGQLRHATRMEDAVSRMPDGGVLFSALDWAPWLDAFDGGRLISAASRAQMFTGGRFASGRASDYGFAWFLDQVRGKPVYYHSGGVPGFVTQALRYPAAGLSVIVTLNCEPQARFETLLQEIVEHHAPGTTHLGLKGAPEPNARRAQRFAAFLAGTEDAAAIASEHATFEKVVGRKPGPRVRGTIGQVSLLESYAVPGGSFSRYRMELDGKPRTFLVGWTPADQIYLFR